MAKKQTKTAGEAPQAPKTAPLITGPVVMGKRKGSTVAEYIAFSDTEGAPVLATEEFVARAIAAALAKK